MCKRFQVLLYEIKDLRNGADENTERCPYVHLSEEHVQNTSNSTFHLLKKKKKKINTNR